MRIRNIEQQDFFTLWSLDWSPLVKERDTIYLTLAVDQRELCFVAEGAGGWQGVLLATRSADGAACFINHLLVLPRYRRKGIGTALIQRLKEACRSRGIRRIWFFTGERNRGFYERLGFSVDDAMLAGDVARYVAEAKQCLAMAIEV